MRRVRAYPTMALCLVLAWASTASAGAILMHQSFETDFAASQSLWQGGPSLGLDSSGRTSGSVGLYYSVKANSGTVNATQNGSLTANYLSEVTAGSLTSIDLGFLGDPGGGYVESLFGASAETGVFLDVSGCLGGVIAGHCVGIPYNIDTDIPVISEGLFLQPSTTHTPVIDTQRSASDADTAYGVGGADLVIGTVGPTMNLDLVQNIYFTPTGLTGLAHFTNLSNGDTGSMPFSIPTGSPSTLSLDLGVGLWEVTLDDLILTNTFRNDINLGLRPAFDYIVGSWPPPGHELFQFGLIDQTFGLAFNHIASAGALRVEVVDAPSSVPEPASSTLLGMGLVAATLMRRRAAARREQS